MSQGPSTDPNPILRRRLTGDEQISAAARLRRLQHRPQPDLEQIQSDLLHFSSTIQRLHDNLRALPHSDALTRTLESTHQVFTALDSAFNHLLTLRHRVRAVSPLQSSPPSTPALLPDFPSTTTHPSRTTQATSLTNGLQHTFSPPLAETSPAEQRAAHYRVLSPPTSTSSAAVPVYYNPRTRHSADGDGLSIRQDSRLQSEPQDDSPWYSTVLIPFTDRPPTLGWTPPSRLPPTQLDSTTPGQIPTSIVQFSRQSRPSVPTTSSTSSSSSSSSSMSSTDTNNDPNSTANAGDGDSAANDDLTGVDRAATRLFQRLSSLQETTRRLRERRWSNLYPDRVLGEPDVYSHLLRRRVLSTAPPMNAGADASAEEENKENVQVALDANGDPIVSAVGVLVRHYGRKNSLSVSVVKKEGQRLGPGSTWDHSVPWPLPTRPRVQQNTHCELEVTLPRRSFHPVVCS